MTSAGYSSPAVDRRAQQCELVLEKRSTQVERSGFRLDESFANGCDFDKKERTYLSTTTRLSENGSVPRGLLGVHALDVLSQTPDNVVRPELHCSMDSDYAGFYLEILLCVRFVVVVLVLDLSQLRVMIRRVGFTH